MTMIARALFSLILCAGGLLYPVTGNANSGIASTKHNLSVSGPGQMKALTETRICVFCHTPHNSTPSTPLWNKTVKSVTYELYSSTTMSAHPSQPTGSSRLCLSCHDGTLALGAVVRPARGIAVSGEIAPAKTSYLGTILSGDHPFSFSYYASVSNPYAGLAQNPPPDLPFFGATSNIECSTCHDAHEDTYRSPDIHGYLTGKFLVADDRFSGLCIKCHTNVEGWNSTTCGKSLRPVNAALPLSPKEWPTWPTVAEWGCSGCHIQHSAGGPQRLLYYKEEERNCYTCHNGKVAQKNIIAQFQKASRHPVEATTGAHNPKEAPNMITDRHVECTDCHNPHAQNNKTASAPSVSGRLEKVSGLSRDTTALNEASYEYEICFKCHAEFAPQTPLVPRVAITTNTLAQFDTSNPSFHPVVGSGTNPNVPSIPSSLEPSLLPSSFIYCTDCHSDDSETSRGPHGSSYAPILRDRYETADATVENYQNYALCYRCHNRTVILADTSFKKKTSKTTATGGGHSGHLANGAPCSACHTAHGVQDDGQSGSHTHLINFDTRIVSPMAGKNAPLFADAGSFSGSCTLVCHGRVHDNESYPQTITIPKQPFRVSPKKSR